MKILANPVEDLANQQQSLNFLYPNATWVWILCGEFEPENALRLRSLMSRDLLALGSMAMRQREKAVALVIYGDPAQEYVQTTASMLQAWETVVCNGPDLKVQKPYDVCLKTAKFALMYGEPTEKWDVFLEQKDPDFQVIERSLKLPGTQPGNREIDSDPYAQYESIVQRLRTYRIQPFKGLEVRDYIDIRPQPKF